MDIETAEAVDTLRGDIHRVERKVVHVETSLTARIEHVETSLTGKIEHVETSLNARIEHVETSLNARIEQVETSLTAKLDEQKRHADVHFESVHDDIRLLAEHLVTLSTKIDSLPR